jgi:multidrug resistance efflux pump
MNERRENMKIPHSTPFKFILVSCLLSSLLLGGLLLSGCTAIKELTSPDPTATPAPVRSNGASFSAEGHIVPQDYTSLSFTTAGDISEIPVKEGDQVAKGNPLVNLSDRAAFEASLAAAEMEQLAAQQQLDDLNENAAIAESQADLAVLEAENAYMDAQKKLEDIDTDEYQDKIDEAEKTAADAQDELKTAQEDFDKYKDLDPDNQTRKDAETALADAQKKYNQAARDRDTLINDLQYAKDSLADAQAKLDQAQQDAQALQNGLDPDQLALADARLKNATTQVAAAQAALDKLSLAAPYDARVLSIEMSVGEHVLPNQTVIVLADTSAWYVETSDLTESDVVKVSVGQPVTVKPDALPEVELAGTVESVAETFSERSGDITYVVRIRLDETDPLLRWGMTVEVLFEE